VPIAPHGITEDLNRQLVRPYGGVSAAERVAARRAQLLEAGLECFGTRGFAATGVKDLCRTARLTDRYFYESFRDSRALFLAVFDAATEALFVAVAEAVLAAPDDAEAKIEAAIGTFLRALAADPRLTRVVFSEPPAAGPEANAHMLASLRRFTDLVVATAVPHLPPGTSEAEARILALSVVGTLERVVTEWHAGALEQSVDALTEQCVRLFVALASAG
jgi:AcrR family transcriptional regulator